jgi:hypothetical protein
MAWYHFPSRWHSEESTKTQEVCRVCIIEVLPTHNTIVKVRDANCDVVVKIERNRPIGNRLVPETPKI